MVTNAELRDEAAAVRRVAGRFEAAVAAPPSGAPEHAETLHRLRSERIATLGRVAYSSNAVFLIEMDGSDPTHPDQPLRGIYKPARGERPLWDFPRQTLHMRETAAYLVSAALDDNVVPPTTLRDGPYGPGSVQLFVHAGSEGIAMPAESLEGQLRALAALDVLINNADRKRAHLLLGDDGRLRGIDNALSFLPYPHQRTVLIELGGEPLPGPVAVRIQSLAGSEDRRNRLSADLARLLEHDEVAAFGNRLDGLAGDPVYPTLDPWGGRPFEWW